MTWVKICGITNLEDAQTAVEAGADALGFVFYEKSPRNIDPEAASKIVGGLPKNLERVGVFVDQSGEHMLSIADRVGLTALQIHVSWPLRPGQYPTGLGAAASKRKLRVHLAIPAGQLIEHGTAWFIPDGKGRADSNSDGVIFLDSGTAQQPGGTGRTFNWEEIASSIHDVNVFRFVVAGGLTPTNVAEAMRILKPWGVDVSSGVEASPGKKDPEKVKAFIRAVRVADQKL